jgi:hypothetical protein
MVQPLTPAGQRYVKSNAAAVAHVARAVLRPGEFVVATQAEQVPVMAHHLPRALTFLTRAGPVSDPAVVDRRQLVKRLPASTACTSVDPALASLPVGATMLLVNPLQRVGAKGSAWYSVVNGQVDAVTAHLRAGPAFRGDDVFAPGASAHPYSGVTRELFGKVSSFSSC